MRFKTQTMNRIVGSFLNGISYFYKDKNKCCLLIEDPDQDDYSVIIPVKHKFVIYENNQSNQNTILSYYFDKDDRLIGFNRQNFIKD